MTKPPEPQTSGTQRAAEVNQAMLGVPGYADDSMFFILRYATKAKNTLRACDWQAFTAKMKEMGQLRQKAVTASSAANPSLGTSSSAESATEKATAASSSSEGTVTASTDAEVEAHRAKAAQLREESLDIIKEFPELVRDFDRFAACSRTATMKLGR